jgi:chromosome segregation ATPase
MFRSFLDTFGSLRAEMARLEIENKRLVEHNTVIEKELETLNEHNTAIEKELETLNEENVKFSGAKDDAMKKLAEVEEEKAGLQKELDGFKGLKKAKGWKKRCEEQENRVAENQKRIEKLLEDYQQKMEKRTADVQHQSQQNLEQAIDWKKKCEEQENRATKNQERMEKLLEDYQQKTEKRIAEVQEKGQQNLRQAIDRIKAQQALDMQGLTSVMGFMGLEDLKDGYIFREEVSLDDCVDRINMCQ